jgi:BirA family biotin operon repressor/biotin-[acetyl-CoA-carboxylase] ligase
MMTKTTRDKVLEFLEESRGEYVSGAVIAKQLGFSRNAVWKVVQELVRLGHEIEAVNNRGYCLAVDSDVLSVQGISQHLSNGGVAEGEPLVRVHDCVESTNIIAKELAVAGARHGTLVIAQCQSAGKGRYERSFCSPRGGIYMSVVLRTEELPFSAPTLVTALAAVAVCEAIESGAGKSPRIKWVNDVFLGKLKICGISAEAVTDYVSGTTQWIVVGIGVNFIAADGVFPAELCGVAGSLFRRGDSLPVTRNRLIAEIANRLLASEYDSESLIAAYKSRLMMLGEQVTITSPLKSDEYKATAVDVDEIGRLVVRKDDGEESVLCSGEISLKICR